MAAAAAQVSCLRDHLPLAEVALVVWVTMAARVPMVAAPLRGLAAAVVAVARRVVTLPAAQVAQAAQGRPIASPEHRLPERVAAVGKVAQRVALVALAVVALAAAEPVMASPVEQTQAAVVAVVAKVTEMSGVTAALAS